MRFFNSVLFAASALVSLVAAQSATLKFTDFPSTVQAGKSYTIKYTSTELSSPATIVLRKGSSTNLNTISTLTTTATGGSFVWSVDASLADGNDYALMISQGTENNNYAGPIQLTGGSASAISSATSSGSASSASSAKSALTTISTLTVSGNSTTIPTSSVSAKSNSSVSTGSLSGSASRTSVTSAGSTGSTTTAAQGAPSSTGAAIALGSSPLALIFGAVAAMAYLN